MKHALKTTARVEKRKLIIPNREYWQNAIRSFEGQKITITIEPFRKNRTLKQNSYYWLLITLLAKELGYTKEELHYALKAKLIGTPDIRTGLVRVPSTVKLTTIDMAEYCEMIRRFGAEMGIVLPTPNQYQDLIQLNYGKQKIQ